MKNLNIFKSIIYTLLLIFTSSAWSQVMFKSVYNPFQTNIKTRSTNAGCVADFNGDLVDDLYIINRGNNVIVVNSEGKHFDLKVIDTFDVADQAWTSVSGDTDNNGVPDLISSGEYKGVSHAQYINGEWKLSPMSGNLYAQGSNLVDINNDGWLDYFVCDDDSHSKIYINDKSGRLILTPVIDFKKGDNTDGSGNYGSEWVDVNNDMKPDLYIAKCRAGVDSPLDKRRINTLYINKGNNKFEELADSFKIASGNQSWVGTFGDLDNDGDQDLFIVNHYAPHELYENIDGKYFKHIPTTYLDNNFGLQSVIRDFDNDGLQDMVMVGIDNTYFLRNKGNLNFEIVTNALGGVDAKSMMVGDFNDDGFLDIYAINSEAIARVGSKDDEILINKKNANHFLKVSLQGSTSNKSGVGSKLTAYANGVTYTRFVKAGESYGISNSLQQHFGLGSATKVDSLIINWPSGIIDKYYDLTADNTFYAQEGKCMSKHVQLANNILYLDQNLLTLPTISGMSSYKWSNGAETESIMADDVGAYFLTAIDSIGCIHISKPISVRFGCFQSTITKVILHDSIVFSCKGSTIQISAIDAPKYLWNTGETTRTIEVGSQGVYSCTVTDLCTAEYAGVVDVIIEDAAFTTIGDTIQKGESATLFSSSNTTEWFASLAQPTVIGINDTIITPPINENTSYFARNIVKINAVAENVGHKKFPTAEPYGSNNTLGDVIFNVSEEILLKSVFVRTDVAGVRRFTITGANNTVVMEKDIHVPVGDTRVMLNVILPKADYYRFVTDENVNLANFGHKGPRFVRTLSGTNYPYEVNNVVSITGGTFGNLYYYYFYDWEIEYGFDFCVSDIQEVPIVIAKPNGTHDESLNSGIVYPNPTKGLIKIHSNTDLELFEVIITDIKGKVVFNMPRSNNTLDLSSFINGLYFVQYKINGRRYQVRCVKTSDY